MFTFTNFDYAKDSAPQVQAAPTTSTSGPRVVNTSPSDIIPTEQLLPFDNPDAEFKQVMEWFANGEWYMILQFKKYWIVINAFIRYHQFEALASVRILAAYHPRVIIPQMYYFLPSFFLQLLITSIATLC